MTVPENRLKGAITASLMLRAILSLPSTDRLRDKSPPFAVWRCATTIEGHAMTPLSTIAPRPNRRGRQGCARARSRSASRVICSRWPMGAARSQDDPVIAKVDGAEIHQSDLTLAEEDVGQNAQQQQMSPEAKRDFWSAMSPT